MGCTGVTCGVGCAWGIQVALAVLSVQGLTGVTCGAGSAWGGQAVVVVRGVHGVYRR
jgi:hypothetical protein